MTGVDIQPPPKGFVETDNYLTAVCAGSQKEMVEIIDVEQILLRLLLPDRYFGKACKC